MQLTILTVSVESVLKVIRLKRTHPLDVLCVNDFSCDVSFERRVIVLDYRWKTGNLIPLRSKIHGNRLTKSQVDRFYVLTKTENDRWINFTLFLAFLVSPGLMETRISDAIKRQVRALSYPEESEMGLFFALAVPLDDPVSTRAMSVAFFFEANYKLPTNHSQTNVSSIESQVRRSTDRSKIISIDRKTIYSILESKFESIGYPGRQCLLRSICETVKRPVHIHNGILGDIMRIIFTPSTSTIERDLHPDYAKAENVSATIDDCIETYSSCDLGIYDYISHVYQEP